jgi:hypothetical protein
LSGAFLPVKRKTEYIKRIFCCNKYFSAQNNQKTAGANGQNGVIFEISTTSTAKTPGSPPNQRQAGVRLRCLFRTLE